MRVRSSCPSETRLARVAIRLARVAVRLAWVASGCLFALLLARPAVGQASPAPTEAVNPAVVPTARTEPWWIARNYEIVAEHAFQFNQLHPRSPLLLMIGDSITNNYDKANPPDEDFAPIWEQFYAPRNAMNLGFSGDTTANVLWRLDNGEVDYTEPRVVVVLIGTNNTGWKQQTAEQTEAGIDAVVKDLRKRLPHTKILLLGILPNDLTPIVQEADRNVNAYLAHKYGGVLFHPRRVTYMDIGGVFLKGGQLDTSLFYDPRLNPPGKALHPNTVGQRLMAEAIEPKLAHLMHDKSRLKKTPTPAPPKEQRPVSKPPVI